MQLDSNLTGIIPIGGASRTDYSFPWHDSLMPISKDYHAIQNAVYQCAMAGCKTIWIVSDMEFQPLVKEIVQEWIMDPYSIDKDKIKEEYDHFRIPIYYVPIHSKDRERRDCLAWSILYGATMANEVSTKISAWTALRRFYVSFPHGIFDPQELERYRSAGLMNTISLSKEPFRLTYGGKGATNGVQVGFTISKEKVEETLKYFRKLEYSQSHGKKHPARFFSLDKVFANLYIDEEEVLTHDLDEFYQINTWQGYREYMASPLEVSKPRAIERFERKRRRWKKTFQN